MICELDACDKPQDPRGRGLCFRHKLLTAGWAGQQRMKREREEGYTQQDLKREIFEGARARGIDIKKAGSTSPSSGPVF